MAVPTAKPLIDQPYRCQAVDRLDGLAAGGGRRYRLTLYFDGLAAYEQVTGPAFARFANKGAD